MKPILLLELLGQRATEMRRKRALVALGAHGRATTMATIRRSIKNDYSRAVWSGIIRKV